MKELGIGLIGCGFMGKCHALAYRAASATFGGDVKARLELLCDADPETAARAAQQFGFARSTNDWRALVADPAVDLVSVTVPNALHREMVLGAIAAGKHVYCEKPMALTLEDAGEMTEAARRAGVRTLVGYNYLRNPQLVLAKSLIERGEIGAVTHFRGVYDEDYAADENIPYSWRCRVAEAGTGTLGDLACHLVSVAQFLAGPIEAVCADIQTVISERPLADGKQGTGRVENEDIAAALLRFQSGVRGTLSSSRVTWGRKCHLAWEVWGSRGTISFDQERMNELQFFRADGDKSTQGFRTILTGPQHPPYDHFCPAPGHGLGFNDLKTIEVDHLLRGIAFGEALYPAFDDALAIERVIHGIAASAKSERWVSTTAA